MMDDGFMISGVLQDPVPNGFIQLKGDHTITPVDGVIITTGRRSVAQSKGITRNIDHIHQIVFVLRSMPFSLQCLSP